MLAVRKSVQEDAVNDAGLADEEDAMESGQENVGRSCLTSDL